MKEGRYSPLSFIIPSGQFEGETVDVRINRIFLKKE